MLLYLKQAAAERQEKGLDLVPEVLREARPARADSLT